MNSFISHRLYVAAVTNVPQSADKPAPNGAGFAKIAGIASAIPMELMETGKEPPTTVRRLRTVPVPARS